MPQEELFDIVDDNNQPTGETAPRSKAHSDSQWHRTVHVYFFRESQNGIEILVHLRAKSKDLFPNCWDTRFGGHLAAGQKHEEALAREIKEETGVKLDRSSVLEGPEVKRDKYPNREFTRVFFYEFKGSISDLKFNDGEVQKVKWMRLVDVEASLRNEPDRWSARLAGFREISFHLIRLLSQR